MSRVSFATTSTWVKNKVRPDVIRMLVAFYGEVHPKLVHQEPGFPAADSLKAVIAEGQPGYGMAARTAREMVPVNGRRMWGARDEIPALVLTMLRLMRDARSGK